MEEEKSLSKFNLKPREHRSNSVDLLEHKFFLKHNRQERTKKILFSSLE